MADGQVVKAKTHKGKRVLEDRDSKLIENTKTAMFIRGLKTGQIVNQALKDLFALKKPNSVMLQRKNEYRPFEDQTGLEFLTTKTDSSLFLFGTHSKKRPNNLVMGRFFDGHILDMVELGIEKFKSLIEFRTTKCAIGTKPCLIFAGDEFETELTYKKLKNFLLDFFRGPELDKIRLQGLEHVIQFTVVEGKIHFRSFRTELKKSGTRVPRVELEEIGPSLDLVLRRTRFASDDLMKQACKQPKEIQPKKTKNISQDVFGSKLGRVHMERQDYDKLQTRKMKGLKRKKVDQESTKTTSKKTKKSGTEETI